MHNESKVHHCVTIKKHPGEVYAFWRDFKNLPTFMKDLKDIEILSPQFSLWKIQVESGIAANQTASWKAEITDEIEGRSLSWRSVPGSEVETTGTVLFKEATGHRGTVVELKLDYKVPGGKLGEVITQLIGEDPSTLSLINLRRLKAKLETGEIPTIEGQPSGREENSKEISQ